MGLRRLGHALWRRFRQPGRPRDVFERLDDAAEVHRLTGSAPARRDCTSRGTRSTTTRRCARTPSELGLRIGAVNPNLFQDPDYKLGSIAQPRPGDPRARRSTHLLECVAHRNRARLDRAVAVARRRHQLPRPGRPRRAPRAACVECLQRALRGAAGRAGDAGRVQVLRAGVLRDRHRRLGLGAADLPAARRAGAGCSSTSATTRRGRTSSRSSR